jgi:hypothetical protein
MLLMVLHVLGENEIVIDGTNHGTCLECCLSFEYAPNSMFHVYQSWCIFSCDSIDLVILRSKVKNINS